MKVILNKDLAPLGEEGDVKDVARGYARNYLFPRGIALPYTESTIKLFESRKEEIEARKSQKRQDAAGLKEKIEALEIIITMPAGPNGKLYGAVTSQTVADELAKQGYQIERKRVEVPGNHFKSVGKYKVTVKLYESASAELNITIQGQPVKEESRAPAADHRRDRRRPDQAEAAAETAAEPQAEEQPAEAAAAEIESQPAAETGGAESAEQEDNTSSEA
ncbi:50S ribosomal protein L9 [Breznakiella homolactica]|uniref:Large ribosomal subunit protein bL9 n=1 Tax=Breznakiella homolactica TaxID=2798577 RepID=A0A7T7XKT9_9SPIR|nr:50S ribosomal protein L9 [Breznakiella homolactica]QQO08078.1 50S ribosomal protein L9 [Breznakiella homolactica]